MIDFRFPENKEFFDKLIDKLLIIKRSIHDDLMTFLDKFLVEMASILHIEIGDGKIIL
jgi:hypothetical protein